VATQWSPSLQPLYWENSYTKLIEHDLQNVQTPHLTYNFRADTTHTCSISLQDLPKMSEPKSTNDKTSTHFRCSSLVKGSHQ